MMIYFHSLSKLAGFRLQLGLLTVALGFAVDAIYATTGLRAGWQAGAEHAGRTFVGTVSALVLFGLVLFGRGGHGGCSDPACECG